MQLTIDNRRIVDEPRYDARTVRKVAALASGLQQKQSQQQERLTARELEAVGAEAGLEPAFIQEALAQVVGHTPNSSGERRRRAEFWAMVSAFAFPLLWGALAYLCGFSPGLMRFFTLVAPAPMAVLLGFVAGRKGAGFTAGLALILALAPTLSLLVARLHVLNGDGDVILYALFGSLFAGWLGRRGAMLRDFYFPLCAEQPAVSHQ